MIIRTIEPSRSLTIAKAIATDHGLDSRTLFFATTEDYLAVGTLLADERKIYKDAKVYADDGTLLGRLANSLQWRIGAWYNAGDHLPRGIRTKIIKSDEWKARGGPAYQTCKNCGVTEARFPKYRRRYVSFTHHQYVNDLPDDIADALLRRAEVEHWKSGRIHFEARRYRTGYHEPTGGLMADDIADLIKRKMKYQIIMADCPWLFGDPAMVHGGSAAYYDSMTLEELMKLRVKKLTTDSTTLVLWFPASMNVEALIVCEAWGFEYNTQIIWHKIDGKLGTGNRPRIIHEHLLIGTRENTPVWYETIPSVISAPRPRGKAHSTKPDVFYDLVASAVSGPLLELFARHERKGRDQHGNQLIKSKP